MTQHRPQCPGFTLIEVVIALSLFAFGLLAVASGMAAVSRMLAEGRLLARSAAIAQRRLERIRAEGCGPSGQEVEGPFTVSWNGSSVPHGRVLRVTVRRGGPGARVDTVSSFQRCPK